MSCRWSATTTVHCPGCLTSNLTTVSQDVGEQVRRTVELAISRITGDQAPPQDLVVEPHLVVRAITGPPPSGSGEDDHETIRRNAPTKEIECASD